MKKGLVAALVGLRKSEVCLTDGELVYWLVVMRFCRVMVALEALCNVLVDQFLVSVVVGVYPPEPVLQLLHLISYIHVWCTDTTAHSLLVLICRCPLLLSIVNEPSNLLY